MRKGKKTGTPAIDAVVEMITEASEEMLDFDTNAALKFYYDCRQHYLDNTPIRADTYSAEQIKASKYGLRELTDYIKIAREQYEND